MRCAARCLAGRGLRSPVASRWAFSPALAAAARSAASTATPSSSSSPPAQKDLLAGWEAPEVKALLQQVAETGSLEDHLLWRLRGTQASASKAEDGTEEVEAEEGGELIALDEEPSAKIDCELSDFLLTAELCRAASLRDFTLLAQLGDQLCSPEVQRVTTEELLRIGSSFAGLGALHPPLFASLAQALLAAWPAPAEGNKEAPRSAQLVEVARTFASQRLRHEELFGRIAAHLRASGAEAMAPADALSLLHSHAFLRLGGPTDQDGELGEELWQALEAQALSAGKSVGPAALAELCHVLFLARRVDEERGLPKVQQLLEQASPELLKLPESAWTAQPALHRRLLLLRSALRYLHREAYKALPNEVQQLFRRVHRMEPPRKELRPVVSFTRKLSHVLNKMKIGHMVNADRGPFTLDIVERDRKLVYECNHFDRFYAHSIEKIATVCLQERIVKAMGYKVVQVPHWQWNRIKHRRQRMEYIRMSRYYAIKDRRELAPRDEQPQDVAKNDFDFLGEYFFRKDMPLASWSWFQPRYDASKRLPTSESSTSGTL